MEPVWPSNYEGVLTEKHGQLPNTVWQQWLHAIIGLVNLPMYPLYAAELTIYVLYNRLSVSMGHFH